MADILGLAVSGLGGEEHLVVIEDAADRAFELVGDHHADPVDAIDEGLGISRDGNGIFPGDGVLVIQELAFQPAADKFRVAYLK